MARRRYRPRPTPAGVNDPDVAGARVLLDGRADTVLRRAVADLGGRLGKGWRRRQVRYVPGRSVVAEFELGPTRGHNGTPQIVVVASGANVDGTAGATIGGVSYRWWRFEEDPLLPGLRLVLDADARQQFLGSAGWADSATRVHIRSYRATRRAVIELERGADHLFVKVVRPDRLTDLLRRYTAASAHPLIEPPLASATEGIVVFGAVAGRLLRGELRTGWDRLEVLDAFVDTLGQLSPQALHPVEAPARRLQRIGRLLHHIDPSADKLTEELVTAEGLASSSPRAVHGDLHTGQVMVDPSNGELTGVVDLDTLGIGDELTDRASLLAQLVVLADLNEQFVAPRDALTAMWGRRFGSERLAMRTAAGVIALSPGPFRTQQPDWREAVRRRLALAAELARR